VSVQRFPFAFDRRAAPLLRVLGVRPSNSEVVVDDEGWRMRFGPWRARTPWSNVAGAQVSGGYQWFKAIGPRGSMADRGATFGSNATAGVCITFHEPIPALVGDRMRHPGITVTVQDPDGLARAIERHLEGPEGSA
jgi:hypothetical protein